MLNKKATRYSLGWFVAIIVFVIGLGLVSWLTSSRAGSGNASYCSILLQQCGHSPLITIKETFYLWLGWGLLPTVVLLQFLYQQATASNTKKVSPKIWQYILALLIAIAAQGGIAHQLDGVRRYVNDFAQLSTLSDVSFLAFESTFMLISLFTVGLLALIFTLVSSRIQANKKGVKK